MQITESVREMCLAARAATTAAATADDRTRCRAVLASADALVGASEAILAANAMDLAAAKESGTPDAILDRLCLTKDRILAIAEAMRELTALPDPIGGCETFDRPAGICITRRRVPLGVVAIIYEARPNVTADAAALCLRSGNVSILRGGKEAIRTNTAIVEAIRGALPALGLPRDCVQLIPFTERESASALMSMRGLVDVLIPRGGKGLIRSCVDNARVPVIETGAGNCHVFVDKDANLDKALAVTINAKCARPSVCNAAETLLLHREIAARFLPQFYAKTRTYGLVLRADEESRAILPQAEAATIEDFETEYNDYIMAVKVVGDLDEALVHIERFGTRHSECILTENKETAARFLACVDAAAVYHNASTRFTDGGVFGFGAEIGISTQKLHARGPMGLDALTTIKYEVTGDGAVRI